MDINTASELEYVEGDVEVKELIERRIVTPYIDWKEILIYSSLIILSAVFRVAKMIFMYTVYFLSLCGVFFSEYMLNMIGEKELLSPIADINPAAAYSNINMLVMVLFILTFVFRFINRATYIDEGLWSVFKHPIFYKMSFQAVILFLFDVLAVYGFYRYLTSGLSGGAFTFFADMGLIICIYVAGIISSGLSDFPSRIIKAYQQMQAKEVKRILSEYGGEGIKESEGA